MATLTIRLPDDKAERLKNLAAQRDISVNKLFEEWATIALAEFDARASFVARAQSGSAARGLELLAVMQKREAAQAKAGAGSQYSLHDSAKNTFTHKDEG